MLAGATGSRSEFLQTVAQALSLGLGCMLAAVGEVNEDKSKVRMLVLFKDGKFSDPYTYDLAGTPCEEIYTSADVEPHIHHCEGLCALFPTDEALVQMSAESYRAEAFHDVNGNRIGHVFVIHNTPTPDSEDDMAFFRLISQRVGAEFNRWQVETALLKSEERFRGFAEIASDWFWEMDADLRFSYFSPRNKEITGFNPDLYIGKSRREISYNQIDNEHWKRHLEDLDAHREFRDFEYDLKIVGDRILTISINGKPAFDTDGNFQGYFGTGKDITERMRAEEELASHRDNLQEIVQERTLELKAAKEEAESASRAKSVLMANMSHELRTPLNAILGFSEIMKEETFGSVGSDKNREYLDDIYHSGQHLLELINDILDVSAIEAGVLELYEENVSLADVVEASSRLIVPRAESGRVTVTFSIDPKMPLIYVDARRLRQVLLNLLSNAVKFTPAGGEVSVRARLNDDGSLAVTVADNGIGMNEGEVILALSPFGQVDSGFDRKHEGTGLGLPMTWGLMELHGGNMEIKSEKDLGTSVTVTFPRERIGRHVGS